MPPKNDAPANWAHGVHDTAPFADEWWKSFSDPTLTKLIMQLQSQNLDLQNLVIRLEQSRAARSYVASRLLPSVDAQASYTREKQSDKGIVSLFNAGGSSGTGTTTNGLPSNSTSPTFNLYQYGFDATWELDLFGKTRRSVEAADATIESSKDQVQSLLVSLEAELARDYLQLRSLQSQVTSATGNVKAAREFAALTHERQHNGFANDLEVTSAEAELASAEAQLPPLNQQASALINAIALLLAEQPGSLDATLTPAKSVPAHAMQVPIGIPADLAQRRPDVRAAEAQLHAATAQVGVAKANFFPQITLMGNGALQALQFSNLDQWAARTYGFGPQITIPIFEGGKLTAQLELANEQQKAAALTYRKALLGALHDVDNALTALHADQARNEALAKVASQDREGLLLARERYKKGLSDYLEVLTAQRGLFQAQMQYEASAGDEQTAFVQLYKALGGGWQTTDIVAHKESKSP